MILGRCSARRKTTICTSALIEIVRRWIGDDIVIPPMAVATNVEIEVTFRESDEVGVAEPSRIVQDRDDLRRDTEQDHAAIGPSRHALRGPGLRHGRRHSGIFGIALQAQFADVFDLIWIADDGCLAANERPLQSFNAITVALISLKLGTDGLPAQGLRWRYQGS